MCKILIFGDRHRVVDNVIQTLKYSFIYLNVESIRYQFQCIPTVAVVVLDKKTVDDDDDDDDVVLDYHNNEIPTIITSTTRPNTPPPPCSETQLMIVGIECDVCIECICNYIDQNSLMKIKQWRHLFRKVDYLIYILEDTTTDNISSLNKVLNGEWFYNTPSVVILLSSSTTTTTTTTTTKQNVIDLTFQNQPIQIFNSSLPNKIDHDTVCRTLECIFESYIQFKHCNVQRPLSEEPPHHSIDDNTIPTDLLDGICNSPILMSPTNFTFTKIRDEDNKLVTQSPESKERPFGKFLSSIDRMFKNILKSNNRSSSSSSTHSKSHQPTILPTSVKNVSSAPSANLQRVSKIQLASEKSIEKKSRSEEDMTNATIRHPSPRTHKDYIFHK